MERMWKRAGLLACSAFGVTLLLAGLPAASAADEGKAGAPPGSATKAAPAAEFATIHGIVRLADPGEPSGESVEIVAEDGKAYAVVNEGQGKRLGDLVGQAVMVVGRLETGKDGDPQIRVHRFQLDRGAAGSRG